MKYEMFIDIIIGFLVFLVFLMLTVAVAALFSSDEAGFLDIINMILKIVWCAGCIFSLVLLFRSLGLT